MNYTNEDYRALAAAAAELVPTVAEGGILIDTDNLRGALFQHSAGNYNITRSHAVPVSSNFFADVTAQLSLSQADLLNACSNMRSPFQRYLRREKVSDEPLPGLSVTCAQLDAVYESAYGPSLQQLVQTLRAENEAAPVILIGQAAAFYPVEHTVRKLLSFMPFIPVVHGLVTAPALTVAADQLITQGKALLEEQAKAKKCLQHTLMLQLKHLQGGKLENYLHTLALKGCQIDSLEAPVYSEPVLACAEDPVMLYADSTPYQLQLPARLFPRKPRDGQAAHGMSCQDLTASIQFALGVAEDVPVLLVRSPSGVTSVPLDKKIYTEE